MAEDAGAEPGISDTWTHQRAWSHRDRRTWRMIMGVPRELGRPCRLHRDSRQEIPAYQIQVDPQSSPRPAVTKRWDATKGRNDG